MEKTKEQDHVDRWLETAWLQDIPNLDLEVEGIVDRMSGLARRFKRMHYDTLAEHGLSYEEWDVLGILRRAGPPFRRSAEELAERSELSSRAMTNRLDRLEKAGQKAWVESAGAEAAQEALIAAALSDREKKQLNSLLRGLMLEFERREGSPGKKL